MTDYGKGAILEAAKVLPATTAAILLLLINTSPIIIAGMFLISIISFFILLTSISRYIINTVRNK